MHILPIRTALLNAGDDLAAAIGSAALSDGDIVVVSSKAIARTEGRVMFLEKVRPTDEAERLAKECHQDPRFTQLVLDETKRLNGKVSGTCPFALLTALQPKGMTEGSILCPNAGLDQSNTEEGTAVGWPEDPIFSAEALRDSIRKTSGSVVAIIVSDSCCRPGRLGVSAFGLVCVGIDPMKSEVGKPDLFGKTLRVTQEAVADQYATAANAVMGNAAQSVPAAIIRSHGLALSDYSGWVPGIRPEEDLFRGFFEKS